MSGALSVDDESELKKYAQGTVSSIGTNELTVEALDGTVEEVVLSSATVFDKEGEKAAKGDLKIGAKVFVYLKVDCDGVVRAEKVSITDKFEPKPGTARNPVGERI